MANEVRINVTADTSKAGKGLDNIRDKMKKVGAAATVAGALITGFAVKSLQQFSSIGDEIHKMSIRTGFSTEALSELRLAAELSGTSLKGMETGIRKMQRTIVDASDGVSLAVDNLDKLGVTLDDLKGQSPERQFEILTEALAGLETQEEKVAVAMNVFGRAGTDLLPMLASGKEGLRAMRQQAHELGLVFDEEAAAKAARLTDAMSTMKGSMTGVMLMVAEQLAPAISTIAEFIEKTISKVTSWTEKNPKLTATIVRVAVGIGGILLVVGSLMIAIPLIITSIGLLTGAFAALGTMAALAWAAVAAPVTVVAALAALTALIPGSNRMVQQQLTDEQRERLTREFRTGITQPAPVGEYIPESVKRAFFESLRAPDDGQTGVPNVTDALLDAVRLGMPDLSGFFTDLQGQAESASEAFEAVGGGFALTLDGMADAAQTWQEREEARWEDRENMWIRLFDTPLQRTGELVKAFGGALTALVSGQQVSREAFAAIAGGPPRLPHGGDVDLINLAWRMRTATEGSPEYGQLPPTQLVVNINIDGQSVSEVIAADVYIEEQVRSQ